MFKQVMDKENASEKNLVDLDLTKTFILGKLDSITFGDS